jgi:hypothetical protein
MEAHIVHPLFSWTKMIDFFYFWDFNATFSNISAVSWRPGLVVEEAGVPGENHRPWINRDFRQNGINLGSFSIQWLFYIDLFYVLIN